MSARQKTALSALAALLVVGTAWWWWNRPSPPSPPPPPVRAGSEPGPIPGKPKASGPPEPQYRTVRRIAVVDPSDPPDVPGDPELEAVYHTLLPDHATVRCAASTLDDGHHEPRSEDLHLVHVQSGVLTAAARTPAGTAVLRHHHIPVARLSWTPEGCSVAPLPHTTVSGTLTHADGTPAADHPIRACLHGEFGRTDEQGHFQLDAVVGVDCFPMAFVEAEDGRFGMSKPVGVTVEGEVEGVELVLPREALWLDEPTQRRQAAFMVKLFTNRLSSASALLDAVEPRLEALSGEDAATARALLADQIAFVEHVEQEMERLEDPDEQLEAFRDAWMSQN